jgi:CubicO group peptidase (beta-lactamase class C family)
MPTSFWSRSTILRQFYCCGFAAFSVLTWQGCKAPATQGFVFKPEKLAAMDAAIEQAIAENRMRGAVLWIEHRGAVYQKAFGQRAVEPAVEGMTEDTIFDAASLTKVVATTPAIMLLAQRGLVDVEAPVHKYIEEFQRDGRDEIKVRHLLTHTSGLPAGLSRRPEGPRSAIAIACQEKLLNKPGSVFRYSDINFILLGEIVERVDGRTLQSFVSEEIFLPMKMRDTRYLPWRDHWDRIAPTEPDGTNMLRGVVHDPTARRMGGVAGHAGLFTTAADLARFARMILNQGQLDGKRFFRPDTITSMTTIQSSALVQAKRGFGWDIDSAYSRPRGDIFPLGSFGHTGFTGTSIWIDPTSNTFWILMTSRLHPGGKGNILSLQRSLGSLAAEAVGLFPATNAPVPSSASPVVAP